MEILTRNFIDTYTSIRMPNTTGQWVDSTPTARYLTVPDTRYKWIANTAGTGLVINFDATVAVSRLALAGHNLKNFRLYYNGATASTFALTTTADTTVSNWASNSQTANFLRFPEAYVTSVSLDINSTMAGDLPVIGYMYLGALLTTLEKRPSAANYRIEKTSNNVEQSLSDGSTRVIAFNERWQADLSLEHITATFRSTLDQIYRDNKDVVFCPFGTATGWDEVIFPAVWVGPFDFYRNAGDAASTGYNGTIRFRETLE